MNRRLQKSHRRRKLEFSNEFSGAPETNDGAYKNTSVLAKFRQADYNVSAPPGISDDINISTCKTKFSSAERVQLNVDTVNACRNTAGKDNVSCKEDFKIYENMLGLSPFSSLSVSDDTDELQTDFETVTQGTSDVCTTITQRVPNVHGVWNTLGSRCTNVADSLGISKYESLMEGSTIENSDAKIETDVTSDLDSTKSHSVSRHQRFYHKPVEQNFSGDESMEVDNNRDVNDDGYSDDKKECDSDDDDEYDEYDDDNDDCDDNDDDDHDGGSDNNSDDDSDDGDSDDEDGYNHWRCTEEFNDKSEPKIDKVCGGDHDGKANKQHNSYSSLKLRRKDRHKDIEAHIKKHIMEIQRKMAILKQRENKKRKRYTKCINSNTTNRSVKQLQIQPIQRSKRLAEPIRCAILKRRALRSAWQGCRGSCCGKACWAKWGWVNIKRVLSDYW